MSNDVFYVYPQMGKDAEGNINPDKSTAIPAKFLVVNGARSSTQTLKGQLRFIFIQN